jgi:hypothetical protein
MPPRAGAASLFRILSASGAPVYRPRASPARKRFKDRGPVRPSARNGKRPGASSTRPPEIGSASWTRTNDLAVNSRLLYQLSYRGSRAVAYSTDLEACKPKGARRPGRRFGLAALPRVAFLNLALICTASLLQGAALRTASWRSGYAEDCKSLHPGSIPGEASIKKARRRGGLFRRCRTCARCSAQASSDPSAFPPRGLSTARQQGVDSLGHRVCSRRSSRAATIRTGADAPARAITRPIAATISCWAS